MQLKKQGKNTNLQKNNFRSKLENDISAQLDKLEVEYSFEPLWGKLSYTIPAKECKYLPDFYVKTKTGKLIIIECKGIWVYEDRYKHLLIRRAKPNLDIRFIFSNSKNKIRKGSNTTYADICNGNGRGSFKGIIWKYADKKIPEEWLLE